MQGISYKLKEQTKEALYKMQLHDSKVFLTEEGIELIVIRVSGGWIYYYVRLDCNSMSSVFVPVSNEFLEF